MSVVVYLNFDVKAESCQLLIVTQPSRRLYHFLQIADVTEPGDFTGFGGAILQVVRRLSLALAR